METDDDDDDDDAAEIALPQVVVAPREGITISLRPDADIYAIGGLSLTPSARRLVCSRFDVGPTPLFPRLPMPFFVCDAFSLTQPEATPLPLPKGDLILIEVWNPEKEPLTFGGTLLVYPRDEHQAPATAADIARARAIVQSLQRISLSMRSLQIIATALANDQGPIPSQLTDWAKHLCTQVMTHACQLDLHFEAEAKRSDPALTTAFRAANNDVDYRELRLALGGSTSRHRPN